MATANVFLVHLRRPKSATEDPNERRDDPFYEFGSFGCTKCHSKNLFHPRRASSLQGARLAFAQGGPQGFRLICLSPPISVQVWADNCEARWAPAEMPFKYRQAPVLAHNFGPSDFPLIEQFAREASRDTIEGGFSSRFRSRSELLSQTLASEVIEVYQRMRRIAPASAIATTYDEALPWAPPTIDGNRRTTYQRRIRDLEGETIGAVTVAGLRVLTETQLQPRCGVSQPRRQSGQRRGRCS